MSKGYSFRTLLLNEQADPRLLGVKLGKKCISRGLSVADVAAELDVSRQTVYNWFAGTYNPNASCIEKIEQLLKSIKRK